MTRDELVTLIIDQRADLAEALTTALRPEVELDEIDYTSSVHRAIQSHIQVDYNVCFISDKFPIEDLQTFFDDFKKLEKKAEHACVFIQVKEKIADDFDPEPLKALGFTAFITRKGTFQDKESVREALHDFFHEKEVETRTFNTSKALNVWLGEIDRVARDKRRGKESKMNTIAAEGISRETEYDEEVLKRYYDELEKRTEDAAPEESTHIEVPENVMKRDLPKLEQNKYVGASSRVWNKLLKMHGVKDLKAFNKAGDDEASSSEEAPTEEAPPVEAPGEGDAPAAPAEEPQDGGNEAPVEEAPVEETPVEDAPAEEAPKE